MAKYKKLTKKTFNQVLNNIQNRFANACEGDKDLWVESFNELLDDLLSQDFFGTEGQLDPRGDHRD